MIQWAQILDDSLTNHGPLSCTAWMDFCGDVFERSLTVSCAGYVKGPRIPFLPAVRMHHDHGDWTLFDVRSAVRAKL